MITAIKWSCNIFFYDVGRRLTSDVYDAYAYKLGLGQRTGVEVSEALGRLTTKNDSNYIGVAGRPGRHRSGQHGGHARSSWPPTRQRMANRGTRYRTHFVKAILDTNTGEVLQRDPARGHGCHRGHGATPLIWCGRA